MATIKSFTSLEQSKKLAEILPLESADMHYEWTAEKPEFKLYIGGNIAINYNLFSYRNGHVIPAWSLAALLDVLPYPSLHKTFTGWRCDSYNKEGTTCKLGESADNPVDACVAIIEKLHELKMLCLWKITER